MIEFKILKQSILLICFVAESVSACGWVEFTQITDKVTEHVPFSYSQYIH